MSPGRGRPRSEAAERAILEAAAALLTEVGFSELSIEAVAARAGVGKPTVYRRWRSKIDLTVDAVLRLAPALDVPRTDDPLADLRTAVSTLVSEMTGSAIGRAVLVLAGERETHEELARRLDEDYLAPRRAALRAVLQRGVDQGLIADGHDLDVALDLMLGAPTYRWLTTGRPVEAETTDAAVTTVWNGLRR